MSAEYPKAEIHSADWYMARLRQHGPVITEMHVWPKAGFKVSIVSKLGRVEFYDSILVNALEQLLFKTRKMLREHVCRQQG